MSTSNYNDRLTLKQKEANNFKWFKDRSNKIHLEHQSFSQGNIFEDSQPTYFNRMKIWYDLFNNKVKQSDLSYVATPYGEELGAMPARMKNKDIISGKVKAMLGMETKRPFKPTFYAVNKEATTRKEQEEFGRMKDYVVAEIIKPLKEEAEAKMQAQTKGRDLSEEELQEISAQIDQELQQQTPEEVKKYMHREHQDPAEVMYNQLARYIIKKLDIENKFDLCFKHGMISAREIMYLGIHNNEPESWVVNPIRFNYHKTENQIFIQDSPSASAVYYYHITEIVKLFGDELSDKDIDKLQSELSYTHEDAMLHWFDEDSSDSVFNYSTHARFNSVRAVHTVWKSLRRMGYLTYKDKNGVVRERIVDESYTLMVDAGDISIEWEWLPEVYETWKLGKDTYVRMGAIPNQIRDIDNPYECKLPYYGVVYDDLNSDEISLVGRLVDYQYLYNIINFRIEMLAASDKGKKVLMNINAVPNELGINIETWAYYMETSPTMFYNPDEEGAGYQDANTVAKVIDLSLASDIQKYVDFAEYIRIQAGKSVGITDNVEGQTGPREAVNNTKQNLLQSSHILEPYFNTHAMFKAEYIKGLVEAAKIAYAGSGKEKLTFILDEMSNEIINIDLGLLEASTFGIFYEESSKAEEIKDTLQQLAHAAMQAGQIELSAVVSVMKQDSLSEAEEILKVAEDLAQERSMQAEQQRSENALKEMESNKEMMREKHEMTLEEIITKEEERRKTVIIQASLTAASFNPDIDKDKDGQNDFVEIARNGLDADIRQKEFDLKQEKTRHDMMINEQNAESNKEKIKLQGAKNLQK